MLSIWMEKIVIKIDCSNVKILKFIKYFNLSLICLIGVVISFLSVFVVCFFKKEILVIRNMKKNMKKLMKIGLIVLKKVVFLFLYM